MSEAARLEVARILVVCDTSSLGEAALDAAATLARKLDVGLTGLYIENTNLLRMATLPFVREYGLTSVAPRPVEADELMRTLRRQAEAVRGALSRTAQNLSVPWSFQVVRGGVPDSVLEMMQAPDLAVFGRSGQFVISQTRARTPQALQMRYAAIRQPVVTVYDETPAADRALATAAVLAELHHADIVILLISTDATNAARMRVRALEELSGMKVNVRFHSLPAREVQVVRAAVENYHAAALLWHGVQTPGERKVLATLVDILKCPVVLVS